MRSSCIFGSKMGKKFKNLGFFLCRCKDLSMGFRIKFGMTEIAVGMTRGGERGNVFKTKEAAEKCSPFLKSD